MFLILCIANDATTVPRGNVIDNNLDLYIIIGAAGGGAFVAILICHKHLTLLLSD